MTTQTELAPLPANLDAERIALGSVLVATEWATRILDTIEVEGFFLPGHQIIFAAMLELRERGRPTDLLSVHDELIRSDKLSGAGGISYVSALGDGMPAKLNVQTPLAIIKSKARLRRVIRAAEIIQQEALKTSDDAGLIDRAIERFSQIARDAEAEADQSTGFRDASVQLLHQLGANEGTRIFTDVDELDRIIGGFRPGELVLFTAETGVGKTLLAQQMRRRACRDGYHALYASGEMLAPHLVSRELATEAKVEHWKMRRNERLTREDWNALTQAASKECNLCRVLDGELTLAGIRRMARQMKGRTGLELLIVDYDELVTAPGENEFEQQRNLVRSLKSLAMELSIPVIVISQLRKALQGEDRKHPTLQRLYGSGAKPKHSSIVIYVERQFVQELAGDETASRIVILKSRDGRIGVLETRFNVKTLRFESPIPE